MELPVGYHKFHKNTFINYQLNRLYSLGYTRKKDVENAASKIKSFNDYINQFNIASDKAYNEGRLKNAAMYCRASEFLIKPDSKNKIPAYNKFIQLFDEAFSDENFERHKVPYNNSHLSAIKIPSSTTNTKGTVIGCSGFDSFIEEFYWIWKFFAENEYDVIAFEGPGQGGSLRNYGLTFEQDWKKPTSVVLDYFKI